MPAVQKSCYGLFAVGFNDHQARKVKRQCIDSYQEKEHRAAFRSSALNFDYLGWAAVKPAHHDSRWIYVHHVDRVAGRPFEFRRIHCRLLHSQNAKFSDFAHLHTQSLSALSIQTIDVKKFFHLIYLFHFLPISIVEKHMIMFLGNKNIF